LKLEPLTSDKPTIASPPKEIPMRILSGVILCLVFTLHTAASGQPDASASAKHPFTPTDWSELRSASAAAVSPSGAILYTVSHGNAKGPSQREWWTISADGNGAIKLEMPDGFSPSGFTSDGKGLYGSWKVNKLQQFAIFPLANLNPAASPSMVVVLPRGIASAMPSPDGKRFAIVADPRPIDPMDEVRHIQEPGVSSLYVVNSDGTGGAWWCSDLKGVAGALVVGGGASAAAWSSDSSSMAVLSQLPKLTHHDVSGAIDVCNATGSRHITDIPNGVNSIAWADGGSQIAFLSTTTGTQTPEHVWTVPSAGGSVAKAIDRTPTLDGTAAQLASDVAGHLWVLVGHGVQNDVEEFRDGNLIPGLKWPEGVLSGLPARSEYSGSTAGPVFTIGDPFHTTNLAVVDGDHLRKITFAGDPQLATNALGPVKAVQWKSKEGVALEGIATFPAGYVEGRKYPFVVLPHGGPEANDHLALDPFSRMIAGAGYVVLQPEYRGSTGYGQAHLEAIYQHFGDRAYKDVDSATDFAVAQGWADPDRLAIFGWSAGGFMTSWTVTQTNRYKAAVEGAGITDWEPFLWTSDVPQTDFDNRWTDEDPDDFRRFSAMAYAKSVTTPLLILHGEADVRVPFFQGMEYFQILAARGKTVRMVSYPGSGHFPALWEQRINVFDEVLGWLAKYDK
jgi:dipeptidyl aminopeptidase/acylaminoacyl peptidase